MGLNVSVPNELASAQPYVTNPDSVAKPPWHFLRLEKIEISARTLSVLIIWTLTGLLRGEGEQKSTLSLSPPLYLLYVKHLDPSSTCFSLPSCAHRLWRCVTSWLCPISDQRTSPSRVTRRVRAKPHLAIRQHSTARSHQQRATGGRCRCSCPSPNSSTSRWRPRLADVGIPGAHRRARGASRGRRAGQDEGG